MPDLNPFADSIYENLPHLAERELVSFIAAVTDLYGADQADLSAADWLDEADSRENMQFCTEKDWRAVTIAASARLANRLAISLS